MTVEGFALCPALGCTVSVWGATRSENYCKAHGGNRFDFPEIDDTEWGEPRSTTPATAAPTGGGGPAGASPS